MHRKKQGDALVAWEYCMVENSADLQCVSRVYLVFFHQNIKNTKDSLQGNDQNNYKDKEKVKQGP